ncbi:Rrf2 family transcriptional regulator [Verrucomicrobia bacterium]|nr:Rrf2 family transcriptional regulator [Verrucomicrobiota bacterium]
MEKVKLSVKSDYAARAVLGLSRQYQSGKALRIEDLAKGQNIPQNYLVQILIELKSQKIVKSIRGKEGGYLLNKAPEDITFGEILRCIHGDIFEPAALGNNECPQALKSAWKKMQSCLDETADSIHFRAIMEEDNQTREMYYI